MKTEWSRFAFPNGGGNYGLEVREYFAAAAMQGLCAALNYGPGTLIHPKELAEDAVSIAEALITALVEQCDDT